jgi:hypothetical protein
MPHRAPALAVLLAMLPLAVGCAHAARSHQVSEGRLSPRDARTPIPGHPPVTTSGVVASYDPAADIVTFTDGRIMKLTDQSTVLQPVERRAIRPGEQVVVRSALPIGVQSAKASAHGKRQRMATVASIDQPNQLVLFTDGSAVRVTADTRMHMGTEGDNVILTDLRPGDELLIVMTGEGTAAPGATGPSALPRAARGPSAMVPPGTRTAPDEASELMVFRNQEAP